MTLNFKRIYLKKNLKLNNLKTMFEKNINNNLIVEFEELINIHKAQLDFLNLFVFQSTFVKIFLDHLLVRLDQIS